MDHLRASGVVVSDGVVFSRYGERIDVEGRVTTASGGVLDVRKVLLAEGDPNAPDPRVRAVSYRYMALWQPSPGVSHPLFRYDEYDGDLATLHRHDFGANGAQAARYAVRHDRLPYMHEVVLEAEALAARKAAAPQ